MIELVPLYGPPSLEGTCCLHGYRLSSPIVLLLALPSQFGDEELQQQFFVQRLDCLTPPNSSWKLTPKMQLIRTY